MRLSPISITFITFNAEPQKERRQSEVPLHHDERITITIAAVSFIWRGNMRCPEWASHKRPNSYGYPTAKHSQRTLHLQIRRANQEQEVLDEAGYADFDLTVQLVVGGSSCRESPRHRRQGEGTGLDRVGLILFSSFLNDAGFLPSFKIEVMTGTKVEMIASNRCWQ